MSELRGLFDFYLAQIKISMVDNFQYRMEPFLWLIGVVAEPVVYLVVWSSVAQAQGGSVGGYTPGEFAGYYIVWTLVRQINIALTPWAWEERVRQGEFSGMLLRPLHPFHVDLAGFFGMKVMPFLLWLPIAAVLTVAFRPTLNPEWWEVIAFVAALVTGFMVRFVWLWALGLITFWTTRVGAVFDLYFTIELLFSGRLVPLSLMPEWAQQVANLLPFKWAFGFSIELVLGRLSPQDVLVGFGAELFWFLAGVVVISIVWPLAVRRYSAVGA